MKIILDNTEINDPKIKIKKLKYHRLSILFIYSYIIREKKRHHTIFIYYYFYLLKKSA
jgi:hypothetical protein